MFSAGIQLANSSFNSLLGNYLHDQQMWGVALFGSHFNTLRGNLVLRIHGLGAEDHFGQGFQITGNGNLMLQNHLEFNCTGILFYDLPASTENYVWQNVIHSSHQPGVLVPEPSNGNFILENDVTGNGMLHLAPSGRFDLWDEGPMNNVWRGNRAYAPFSPF
jgi:parallel beta-helix repeat protein